MHGFDIYCKYFYTQKPLLDATNQFNSNNFLEVKDFKMFVAHNLVPYL